MSSGLSISTQPTKSASISASVTASLIPSESAHPSNDPSISELPPQSPSQPLRTGEPSQSASVSRSASVSVSRSMSSPSGSGSVPTPPPNSFIAVEPSDKPSMSSPPHSEKPPQSQERPVEDDPPPVKASHPPSTRSTPRPTPTPHPPSASHKPSASPSRPVSPSSPPRSSFSFPFNPSDIPSVSFHPSDPVLTSTVTSTIHPESTFSIPVSVPFIDPSGVSGFSTPPFVTSLSTSESNGMTVVVTHVMANPTNFVTNASSSPSFFEDQGKTAGVFLVVGIVVAAFIFGILFCIRRRRRKNRQAEWLATIPPRHDEDPFADPRPLSLMRETSRPTNRSSIWDSRRVPVPEYFATDMPIPSQPPPPQPLPIPSQPNPVFQPSLPPQPPPRNPNHRLSTKIVPVRREDFSNELDDHSPVGVAITTDKREFNRSRASLMSSPSIYPQSLPGGDDEDTSSFYEMETGKHVQPQYQQPQQQQQQHVIYPASAARKSSDIHGHQRGNSLQSRAMMLTPPLTDDSSSPPSPDFDRRKMMLPTESNVFQKPTLLNVRRRDVMGNYHF